MARRRSETAAERETRMLKALTALSRGEYPNVSQAAKHFNLHYTTLNRRYNGGKSVAESRELQQLFTISEEHAIARTITRLTISGYPVTHTLIEEIADEVRQQRLVGINEPAVQYVTYEPLGEDWTLRFLQRHPHLKTALTRSIELARITEASPEVLTNWYDTLFQTIDELGISWRNTYNCDESGFGIGKRKALRVVVDTTVKQNYQAEPGRQEWVTVMECICADGSSIPPLIIFKGENVSESWIPVKEIPEGWHVSCNSKGWTSNEHGVKWLKKCFEPAMRDKADGEFRLLICDGHDSHISAEFIRHCIANRIVLLLLPPHCSHLMQPLDVGVFFPLKQAIGTSLDRSFRTGIGRLQKIEWFQCFIKARAKAVNKQNIQGGWRGAGIYPINPWKVLVKISRSTSPQDQRPSDGNTLTSIITESATPFDVLSDDSSINATALHSANTALNDLVRTKQLLHTPARKFIPRLASTTEWLLAENAILRLELKKCMDMLGSRKARKIGKRLALKGQIVISTEEILKAIEEAEAATQNKQKKTGRPRGRLRKNASVAPIVTLEEESKSSDEEEDSQCGEND